MSQKVKAFLKDGCGRCKYYKTAQCKVRQWNEVLASLLAILDTTLLEPTKKWSQPCYTYKEKNVLIVSAFKDYAFISFFKGSLLADKKKMLNSPGDNSQATRQLRYTSVEQVRNEVTIIEQYIQEAVLLEERGTKVVYKKNNEPLPEELRVALDSDQELHEAFYALTPGRQRSYLINITQAKQSATRIERIKKARPKILKGEGLNEGYKKSTKP